MKNTIDTTVGSAVSRMAFEADDDPAHVHHGQQLDLSFATGTGRRLVYGRGQILRARAQGWFDLMRRVVDNAVEWKPAPPAPPEQTALDLRRAA